MKNIFNGLIILMMVATGAHAKPPAPLKEKQKSPLKTESENRAVKEDVLMVAGLQSTYDITFDPCMLGGNYEECIRIANKGLLLVQYAKDKKQLIFTPQKKGETTINIRDENGDIRLILKAVVSESNLVRRVQELKDLLRDIEGLEFKIVTDKIVVDGEVVIASDFARIYAVLNDSSYKDIVLPLVTLSPLGMQMLAEKMQNEINNPNVKVRVFNGAYVLEGQVESADQKRNAEAVAQSFVTVITTPIFNQPANTPVEVQKAKATMPLINKISVAAKKPKPPAKMVRVTIDFVELSKDYLRNFGFNWSPTLATDGGKIDFGNSTTGGVTSSGSNAFSGSIGNLFPKLQTAQNAGYARVLQETVILSRDKVMGSVDNSTVIPFVMQTTGANGAVSSSIKEFPMGGRLKVTPTVENENVNLRIDFDYTIPVGTSQGGAPISSNNKVTTEISVRNMESAAVANVINNAVSTAFNKNPPGGTPNNPLFSLLRSKAFQKNKSQFVVFITPQIVESTSESTDDIKQRYGFKRGLASETPSSASSTEKEK